MAADVPGFLAAMARRNLTATGGFDSGVAGFAAPAPDPMPAPQGPFVDDAANSDAYTPAAPQATPAPSRGYTDQDLANAVAEWRNAAQPQSSTDEMAQGQAELARLRAQTGYAGGLTVGEAGNPTHVDLSGKNLPADVTNTLNESPTHYLAHDIVEPVGLGVGALTLPGAIAAAPLATLGGLATFSGAGMVRQGVANVLPNDGVGGFTKGVLNDPLAAQAIDTIVGGLAAKGIEGGTGYAKDVFEALTKPGAIPLRPGEATMGASIVPGVGPGEPPKSAPLPEELAGPIRDALAGHAAYEESGQLSSERQATLEQRIAAARRIAAAGGNPADALGGLTSADRPVLDLTPEQVDAAKALINRDAATNPRFFQPIEAARALDLAAQGRPVPPSLRASLSKYVTPEAAGPATTGGASTERETILTALKFAIQKEIADTGSLSAESRAALKDGLTPDEILSMVGDESATAHAASQSSMFDTPEEAAARPPVPRKAPIEPIVGPTGYVDQPPLGGRTPPPEPSGTADLPNNEGGFPLHAESPAMSLEDELASFPKYDQPGDLPSGRSPADIRRAMQQAWADGRQASGYGNTQPGAAGGFPLQSTQPALDMGDTLPNFPKYDQPGDLPSGKSPADIRRALQQAWADGRRASGYGDTQPGQPGGFPLHSEQPTLDMGNLLENFPVQETPGASPSGVRRGWAEAVARADEMNATPQRGIPSPDRGATEPVMPGMEEGAPGLGAKPSAPLGGVEVPKPDTGPKSAWQRFLVAPLTEINQTAKSTTFALDNTMGGRLLDTAGVHNFRAHVEATVAAYAAAVAKDPEAFIQAKQDAVMALYPELAQHGININTMGMPVEKGGFNLGRKGINPDTGAPNTGGGQIGLLGRLPVVGKQLTARVQFLHTYQETYGPKALADDIMLRINSGKLKWADLQNPKVRAGLGNGVNLVMGQSSLRIPSEVNIVFQTPNWIASQAEMVVRGVADRSIAGDIARDTLGKLTAMATAATISVNMANGVMPNDPRAWRNGVPMVVITPAMAKNMRSVPVAGRVLNFKDNTQVDLYGPMGEFVSSMAGIGRAGVEATAKAAPENRLSAGATATGKEAAYYAGGRYSFLVNAVRAVVTNKIPFTNTKTTPLGILGMAKPIGTDALTGNTKAAPGVSLGSQAGLHFHEPATPKSTYPALSKLGGLPRLPSATGGFTSP